MVTLEHGSTDTIRVASHGLDAPGFSFALPTLSNPLHSQLDDVSCFIISHFNRSILMWRVSFLTRCQELELLGDPGQFLASSAGGHFEDADCITSFSCSLFLVIQINLRRMWCPWILRVQQRFKKF